MFKRCSGFVRKHFKEVWQFLSLVSKKKDHYKNGRLLFIKGFI